MNELPASTPIIPALGAAEDYYRLRREGIGFIEQMGSRLWTDYNTHDPGITIHEALCYALTDLAYRTGWDIKEILAPATPNPQNPFPDQAFFTARTILTVNPATPDDFRRLLIDLDAVRNAWVFCKACACDAMYYAWCEKDQLTLSYRTPADASLQFTKVEPLGLYDVLLEFEADPELGDLNDRKLERTYNDVFDAEGRPHPTTLELRFPDWGPARRDDWLLLLSSADAFAGVNGASFNLKLLKFNRTKADNTPMSDVVLQDNWQRGFYLSFEIELLPGGETITIENAALRLYGDGTAGRQATVAGVSAHLEDVTASGFIRRYRDKLVKIEQAVESAKATLHTHRNLDEDYCRLRGVDVEDVAVCADVDVAADADIERVQARIWFEIEQYFNPPVRFYTLQELMTAGVPVEDIFDGPELSSGFIKADELEEATLKTQLRMSDIVNRLMDIEGVVAVNNLLLTKYDAEGNAIKGAADPAWSNGTPSVPIFDPNKGSAAWLLFVSDQHQPRLYLNQSRFLFYKNGLPFKPRMDEASDSLTQLRGEADRPKIKTAPKDLPVPAGTYRNLADYFPVQYSFPLTYGIGPDGLPAHVSVRRRAQAKQLKAYLLVFEQLLANAFAQVAHTADLFSLDPTITRTYFVSELSEALIEGYGELVNGLNKSALEALVESTPEFRERRNRFLNHVMARFGEQFSEYALLLTDLKGQQIALDTLIAAKIAFLQAYPQISHDRARAFDYKTAPSAPDNVPGLKKRVGVLLGDPGERAIVVEHLLLRPKFPGDALFPACVDGPCKTCGDEDPYSFRLTLVMSGWTDPFNTNMEMRRFAERTIQQETPSHLLVKTCWVGNDGFAFDQCDPVIGGLAGLLEDKGLTASGNKPTTKEACDCAEAIHTAFSATFDAWYVEKTLDYHQADALQTALDALFSAEVDPASIACAAVLNNTLWAEVQAVAVKYFHHVALYGWQFERFEDAWYKWVEANAKIDWTEERLLETVQAILAANLITGPLTEKDRRDGLCNCAAAILTAFGMDFYDWMDANVKAGRAFEDFTAFSPGTVKLCDGMTFKPDTAKTIGTMLAGRYDAYKEVSYRLRVVVDLLSRLRNTYPVATLHDCDEGSDRNPVRLGQTALGSLG